MEGHEQRQKDVDVTGVKPTVVRQASPQAVLDKAAHLHRPPDGVWPGPSIPGAVSVPVIGATAR